MTDEQPQQPEIPWLIPVTYDNTTLDTYAVCPRKFQYMILEAWRARTSSRPLLFGLALHAALEAWYKSQKDTQEQIAIKLLDFIKERTKAEEEALKTGARLNTVPPMQTSISRTTPVFDLRIEYAIMVGTSQLPPLQDYELADHRTTEMLEDVIRTYAVLYKHEPFTALLVEKNFVFHLNEPGEPDCLYSGNIDLAVLWHPVEKVIIIDHKSTSSLYNFGAKFSPNSQLTGYMIGAKTLREDVSNEACINAILVPRRKGGLKPEDFQRFPNVHRTEDQFDEFIQNCRARIGDIHRDLARGYFPMNTSSCHQYGGCEYLQVCKGSPGLERKLVLSNMYERKPWDPLKRDKGSAAAIV